MLVVGGGGGGCVRRIVRFADVVGGDAGEREE